MNRLSNGRNTGAEDEEQPLPLVEISWDRRSDDTGYTVAQPAAFLVYEDEITAHRTDGRQMWLHRTDWSIWSFAVARLSGHMAVVAEDGASLAVLDPRGECTAQLDTGRDPVISVDISPDGKLVGFTTDQMDVHLITPDGETVWKTNVDGACSVTVPLGAGSIGVGTADGFALLDGRGELQWIRVLYNLSGIFSNISESDNRLVVVGIPGCRVAVLDREAEVHFQAYRAFPAKVVAVAGRTFAVGYGPEHDEFGDPLSGCPYVELLAIPEGDEAELRSLLAVKAQAFDLAPDGTLTLFGEDGFIESWAPTGSGAGTYRPVWGFGAGGDCLALASRGRRGPVFVVARDGVTDEIVFDYRSLDAHRDLARSLRFCVECGREYWEDETDCETCHLPLHTGGWCNECKSFYRLPAGERCPLHGTKLDRRPSK
jgi:hypothetical protein